MAVFLSSSDKVEAGQEHPCTNTGLSKTLSNTNEREYANFCMTVLCTGTLACIKTLIYAHAY